MFGGAGPWPPPPAEHPAVHLARARAPRKPQTAGLVPRPGGRARGALQEAAWALAGVPARAGAWRVRGVGVAPATSRRLSQPQGPLRVGARLSHAAAPPGAIRALRPRPGDGVGAAPDRTRELTSGCETRVSVVTALLSLRRPVLDPPGCIAGPGARGAVTAGRGRRTARREVTFPAPAPSTKLSLDFLTSLFISEKIST